MSDNTLHKTQPLPLFLSVSHDHFSNPTFSFYDTDLIEPTVTSLLCGLCVCGLCQCVSEADKQTRRRREPAAAVVQKLVVTERDRVFVECWLARRCFL